MKTLILFVVLAILSRLTAFSQGCLPEGITFNTQEQIDNFQINYPGCTEIGGDVMIYGFTYYDISNLEGLISIKSINGDLEILFNHILDSLEGLDSLTIIGGDLRIMSNDSLFDLSGLNSLTYIGGYLYIGNNDDLFSLNGLQSLSNCMQSIEITNNDKLKTLNGLNGLTSIFNGMTIHSNASLIYLAGLNNISSTYGYFEILFNPALINLTGLESLTHADGGLLLMGNFSLTDLTGLNSLSTLNYALNITSNNQLESLDALSSLNTIGNSTALIISNNNRLKSLSGLGNISQGSIGNLKIILNDSLSDCDTQSICEKLLSQFGSGEIHDNAPGCNSQAEVEAACYTSINKNTTQEEITIFPNPTSSFITIHIKEGTAIEEAIIYNHLSQKVLTTKPVNNTVDVSGLKAGMYMIEVKTKEFTGRQKMIKQ